MCYFTSICHQDDDITKNACMIWSLQWIHAYMLKKYSTIGIRAIII